MNTLQLKCAIECDWSMSKIVKGVFAADKVSFVTKSVPFGMIVNTEPAHMSGKHWVVVFIDEKNNLEYFDSYGDELDNRSYLQIPIDKFKRIKMNRKRLQGNSSKVCGQYCLMYLMCRCRGYTMNDFVDIFSNDFNDNDECVYRFINDRFTCCIQNDFPVYQTCTCEKVFYK